MVKFACARFDTSDLRDRSEVFVHVEADLEVVDGGVVLCSWKSFPVAELAVALRKWKARPETDRPDFEFLSLSLEGRWSLRICRAPGGWQAIDDAVQVVRVAVRPAAEIDAAIDDFARKVRAESVRTVGSWIEEFFV
ncbi:hypothetical protein [Amycolatopsis circi]|uniref:DUF7878 domain-containing protein n=1 Tax=Amycolatopsis circi TaxID=871959 RepID=UPI000E21D360|nr:hypothetical protein [Amycolatopsis circi]